MADLNDLSKPDSTSNYSTEVLQTIKSHIVRLWTGDYTGMSNLVANMRRWVNLGNGDVKLIQRNSDGSENTIFDSSLKATKTYVDNAFSALNIAPSKADKTTSINTSGGLTGGGDLSTSRTLSIASTSNGYGTRTTSSSAPTGGSDGDIWYQI